MTNYIDIKINLSDGQKDKIRMAIENNEQVSLRLSNENLNGQDIIGVTQTQFNKMVKAYNEGNGTTIRMSKKQLDYNKKIEGGFIGALLALASVAIPLLAKAAPIIATGALSGLATGAAQRIIGKHGKGLYLKRGGCVCEITSEGNGLYLKKGGNLGAAGDGLYLKSGGQLLNVDIKEALKKIPLLKLLFPS